MNDDYLWEEKYRPRNVNDAILPLNIKKMLKGFVNQGQVPNLLLCGTPGVGKTSAVRAMLDEMDADYKLYNGSLEGRYLATLNDDISSYVTSVSFSGGRKYVILDEADGLPASTVQPALRTFINSCGGNASFIFTANFPSRIIEPLHSRFAKIEFKIPKEEVVNLALQFLARLKDVLRTENIGYETDVLVEVIQKYFPDFRKVLSELQAYSAISKKIDTGILSNFLDVSLKQLFKFLKDQDFTKMRHWVVENAGLERGAFYSSLYKNLPSVLTNVGQPIAILLLGKYEYEGAFSVNSEINMSAALTDLMLQLKGEWK